LFQSVTNNATRLSLIKNFTSLNSDIAANTLPQWSFITPNMTDDAHDTNITFASSWERNWITPLLNNSAFNTNETLILLTFDETETYTVGNKVFAVLVGGAIPANLKGTTDNTFYNHYSAISSVSVNWGLPSLGRWDCEANVFEIVANKTGYKNAAVNTTNLYFNQSYPGPLSDTLYTPNWPVPNTQAKCASGQGVLPAVVSTWGKLNATYNYTNVYPLDSSSGINVGGSPVIGGSNGSTPSSAAPAATSSKGVATGVMPSGIIASFFALLAMIFA
jgi:acid phosphatase